MSIIAQPWPKLVMPITWKRHWLLEWTICRGPPESPWQVSLVQLPLRSPAQIILGVIPYGTSVELLCRIVQSRLSTSSNWTFCSRSLTSPPESTYFNLNRYFYLIKSFIKGFAFITNHKFLINVEPLNWFSVQFYDSIIPSFQVFARGITRLPTEFCSAPAANPSFSRHSIVLLIKTRGSYRCAKRDVVLELHQTYIRIHRGCFVMWMCYRIININYDTLTLVSQPVKA